MVDIIKWFRMQVSDFLAQNPVFTSEQFREFQSRRGSGNASTRKTLLAHYERRQRITRVRRGVYAVIPSGSTPENAPVDPYLGGLAAGAGCGAGVPHGPVIPRPGPQRLTAF